MNFLRNKIFIGFVIISFLISGVVSTNSFPSVPRAHASLIGTPDSVIVLSGSIEVTGGIVSDPAHTGLTSGGWIAEATRFTIEEVARIALAALKRRLIAQLQDQLVDWIQNGNKPRFVTDFGSVISDSADKAVGDTLQAIGLSDALCKPFREQIRLGLQSPTFQQSAQCTLSQVVQNVKNFGNDFRSGGWLAYAESKKPANNKWGAEILADEMFLTNKEKRTQEIQQETNTSQGFISVKECKEWTFVFQADSSPVRDPDVPSNPVPSDGTYNDPANPPPVASGFGLANGASNANIPEWSSAAKWICTKTGVTTPGAAIARGAEKALYSDFDMILNANDISSIAGAVLDAAINRLLKEGVKGIQAMSKSESSTGIANPSTKLYTNPNNSDPTHQSIEISTSTRDALAAYASTTKDTLDQLKGSYATALEPASLALSKASSTLFQSSSTNELVLLNASTTVDCLVNLIPGPPPAGDLQNARLIYDYASTTRPNILTGYATRLLGYATTISSIENQISSASNSTSLQSSVPQQSISSLQSKIESISRELNLLFAEITEQSNQIKTIAANSGCTL